MRILHRLRLLILILLCLGITGCSQKTTVTDQLATDSDYTEAKGVSDTDVKDNNEHSSDMESTVIEDNDVSSTDKDDAELEEDKDIATPTPEPTQPVEQVPDIIFEKTSGLVYATSNVNIRSSYSTKADNIISVLKEGTSIERIGIHEEWSKVLYQDKSCYVKTEYLTENIPSNNQSSDNNTPTIKESFAADLSIAADISQLVIVVGNGGSDAVVSYHVKDENGKWREEFSVDGDVGTNGISNSKKEGDSKTPAGLYSFPLAFGLKSDPGAKLTYRRITEYDYWVDDGDSPYYNTWVNSKDTPGDFRSEHLIEHNPSYNYALNINYNPDNTPGLGSAIFLHCYNGSGRTTGCIAVAEKYMKLLVQELRPSAKILIVPSSDDLAKY